MTEKSASDVLHKLLDERGVEYEVYRDINNRCITKWRTYHGAFVFFAVEKEGKLFVETASDTEHSAICTPEQAIAATLKNETLTAEQVREAVEASTWAETSTIREFNDSSWQAIADELNAELGSETCRITASATDGLCSDNPRIWFKLSCGHSFTFDGLGAPVACAVCGKAVER